MRLPYHIGSTVLDGETNNKSVNILPPLFQPQAPKRMVVGPDSPRGTRETESSLPALNTLASGAETQGKERGSRVYAPPPFPGPGCQLAFF